ncbi:hypothetical protein L1887_30083 [Cichorium endivia]|nr:hypothetical protein L1887_30083 [Cichorium endivia]
MFIYPNRPWLITKKFTPRLNPFQDQIISVVFFTIFDSPQQQRTQGFSSSTVRNWFLGAPINPTLQHLKRQNPLLIYESCFNDLKLQNTGGSL